MKIMDLTKAREAAGVSKNELARRLGIPPRSVRRMENRPDGYDPRLSRAKEIADALDISIDELIASNLSEAASPTPHGT